MDRYYRAPPVPSAFFWRRLQSLMGLFLVIFLIEHLLTNSQAALYVGSDGNGFIHAVNAIHNLPYLEILEIFLIGFPLVIHGIWGIVYLWTSKQNSYGFSPTKPLMTEYPRNHAYTWQRITSWILLVGIIAHVVEMRFIKYPTEAKDGAETYYMVPVSADEGLYTLSDRLGVRLYTENEIADSFANPKISPEENPVEIQRAEEKKHLRETMESVKPKEGEVLTVSNSFGTAELLMVRDTFKSPLMIFLYTLFISVAVFHAFNGLWTFSITWGITLTKRSQMYMRIFSVFLMLLIGLLGMSAVWGTYLINLKN